MDIFGVPTHSLQIYNKHQMHNAIVQSHSPAEGLPQATRSAILSDAICLVGLTNYGNAGTIEFFVDKYGQQYFIQVNPCACVCWMRSQI